VTPIRFYGYRTQTGKLERRAVATVRKYFPRILGQYEGRIKEVHIIGYKHFIWDWRWGYHWLYEDGILTFVLPWLYRGLYRSQWILVHDMAHAAQLLSGKVELTPRAATTYYNGKPYCYDRRYKEIVWRDPAGRRVNPYNLPWEVEANKTCQKVFRRDQYNYMSYRRRRAA